MMINPVQYDSRKSPNRLSRVSSECLRRPEPLLPPLPRPHYCPSHWQRRCRLGESALHNSSYSFEETPPTNLSLSVWTTTISVLVKSSDPTSCPSPLAHLKTALRHVTQAVNTTTFSCQRTQSNLQGPTRLRPGTSECLG